MIVNAGHEHLNPQDFNAEIAAHGLNVTLKRGIQCPCLKKESGQPDPGCNLCQGWGFIWRSGTTVQAWGPNRRYNRNFEVQGTVDIGDALFTFQAGTFIAHMDRIQLPDEIIVVSELFTKGEINSLTGASKEKSRFTTILTPVEDAVWSVRNPSSGTPYVYVEHNLVEGSDFEIINGNQIQWLGGGSPPPDGVRYSMRFRVEAEYLIWDGRGRRESSQQLPYVYLAKRLDFKGIPDTA